MKYIFFILTFFMGSCMATTTDDIAEKEKYPAFIRNLRAQVIDFLRNKADKMAVDVLVLRSKELENQAEYFEDEDFYTIENMDDKFNDEFARIDRKYDDISERLESEAAPDAIKAQFIRTLKDDAGSSIDALIRRYSTPPY